MKELTSEERRERRRLRREKQREDNIGRAQKMHAARLRMEAESPKGPPELKPSVYVGCSGWRYWKWRDSFYAGVPHEKWFEHYLSRFDTVEINYVRKLARTSDLTEATALQFAYCRAQVGGLTS